MKLNATVDQLLLRLSIETNLNSRIEIFFILILASFFVTNKLRNHWQNIHYAYYNYFYSNIQRLFATNK